MPSTDSRGWTIPTVDGSAGTWGDELNALFDDEIEADVDAIEATADAAMPKAGGDFTGEIGIKTEKYDLVAKGNLSGAESLDVSAGNFFHGTVTGDTTISFTNWPASHAAFVQLELTDGGAHTITWPTAVKWDGGTDPTLITDGVDLLTFYSRDGGTTIRAAHAMSTLD